MFLKDSQREAIKSAVLLGVIFGFSQFIMFAAEAVLFYVGGEFMVNYNEDPVDMYIAIFSIMMAAVQAG